MELRAVFTGCGWQSGAGSASSGETRRSPGPQGHPDPGGLRRAHQQARGCACNASAHGLSDALGSAETSDPAWTTERGHGTAAAPRARPRPASTSPRQCGAPSPGKRRVLAGDASRGQAPRLQRLDGMGGGIPRDEADGSSAVHACPPTCSGGAWLRESPWQGGCAGRGASAGPGERTLSGAHHVARPACAVQRQGRHAPSSQRADTRPWPVPAGLPPHVLQSRPRQGGRRREPRGGGDQRQRGRPVGWRAGRHRGPDRRWLSQLPAASLVGLCSRRVSGGCGGSVGQGTPAALRAVPSFQGQKAQPLASEPQILTQHFRSQCPSGRAPSSQALSPAGMKAPRPGKPARRSRLSTSISAGAGAAACV